MQRVLLDSINNMILNYGEEFVRHAWGTLEAGNHERAKKYVLSGGKASVETILLNMDGIKDLANKIMQNDRERPHAKIAPEDEDHSGGGPYVDHLRVDSGAAMKCATKLGYLANMLQFVLSSDIKGFRESCQKLEADVAKCADQNKMKSARALIAEADYKYLITLATPVDEKNDWGIR